jgi:hypothetical protein
MANTPLPVCAMYSLSASAPRLGWIATNWRGVALEADEVEAGVELPG